MNVFFFFFLQREIFQNSSVSKTDGQGVDGLVSEEAY